MSVKKKNKKQLKADNLLHYDIALITKDLIRTSVSTLVVFGVLIALYYQL